MYRKDSFLSSAEFKFRISLLIHAILQDLNASRRIKEIQKETIEISENIKKKSFSDL